MNVGARSVWRSRAAVFVLLGLLLAGNVAILVSHRLFYEERLKTLQETRRELEARRDEAREAAEKVLANEQRLRALREGVERFYSETLGARRDRLAPLIEEVYAITRKAGFSPSGVSYAEDEVPGARRLSLSFAVSGTYAEIKRLLAAFENDPGFLVLETVAVGSDEKTPDLLNVNLTVAHYFRAEEGLDPVSGSVRRVRKVTR